MNRGGYTTQGDDLDYKKHVKGNATVVTNRPHRILPRYSNRRILT